GHHVDVRYRYIPRSTESEVKTSRDCSVEAEKVYSEGLLQISEYRQVNVGLSMPTIAKYCSDASAFSKGDLKMPSPVMNEVTKRVMLKLNALRQSINRAILTDIKNNYGQIPGSATVTKDISLISNGATGIL